MLRVHFYRNRAGTFRLLTAGGGEFSTLRVEKAGYRPFFGALVREAQG